MSFAATTPDWISAISTAVIALGVLVAAPSWIRRQARRLFEPGDAPGGSEGEFTELLEDVLRGMQDEDPQWFKDQQRSKSWIERRQRELRRKRNMRELRERQAHLARLDQEDREQDEASERK